MKIGRKFPKIKPATWRLAKKRVVYLNRRQWNQEYLPDWSPAAEIELEQGGSVYLRREYSDAGSPDYIVTENY